MKKGTLTFSGILTIIFSVILLGVSALLLGRAFNLSLVSEGILAQVIALFWLIFVGPVSSFLPNVSFLNILLPALLFVFCVINFFGGIFQLKSRKAEGKKLVRAKKFNKISNIFRIIFCLFIVFFVVLCFIKEEIKLANSIVSQEFGFEYVGLVVAGIFLVLGVLSFVLPTLGYKGVKGGTQDNAQYQDVNQNGQDGQYYDPNNINAQGDGQYEETGYQEQHYAYNNTQPINPNDLITDQTQQGDTFSIVPGQNGVPINITQKGLEDLARLERLHASGAIDDLNYYALKQKICEINLG